MDTKIMSNGNFNLVWIPENGLANPEAPTAAEIAAGQELSGAVSIADYELAASESNSIDDRSVLDPGNAVEAGFAQYGGTLGFFRDADPNDTGSLYNQVYELFKRSRQTGYIVLRVLQNVTHQHTAFAAGDIVSVFKFMSDAITDDTSGEDSYKMIVEFTPQGRVSVNTLVAPAPAIVLSESTLALDVGDHVPVKATIGGRSWTQGVRWTSSDSAIASVSQNGVVTGVADGSATITASHPSVAAPVTVAVTVG